MKNVYKLLIASMLGVITGVLLFLLIGVFSAVVNYSEKNYKVEYKDKSIGVVKETINLTMHGLNIRASFKVKVNDKTEMNYDMFGFYLKYYDHYFAVALLSNSKSKASEVGFKSFIVTDKSCTLQVDRGDIYLKGEFIEPKFSYSSCNKSPAN